VEFQTEDGVTLVGYYYPAAANPAPVVVLMHWAGGDQKDWLAVGMVSWLQNRGAPIPDFDRSDFDTPYPFPSLAEGTSFAVFTFDFRGYGESGGKTSRREHILDARAAYQAAAGLEGVDSSKIAGIGASIGADAVVDGCVNCIGALSLGPGAWLQEPYASAVKLMDDAGKPVWCVAAQDAPDDVKTCNSASGALYKTQVYPQGGHAMTLFQAKLTLEPPIEASILDFLAQVFLLP
jgi:dienelactone hydrolase